MTDLVPHHLHPAGDNPRHYTVGLINTYSTLNIGDSAIYSALASLATNAHLIGQFQDAEPEYTPGVQIHKQLEPCDAYISVGGDIFNNAREHLVTQTFLKNLHQLMRSPRNTMLFGQSIPRSCHGLSFRALAFGLRRLAAVCVRDAESHQRLKQAGVEALLSYDTAFSLTVSDAAQAEVRQACQQLDIALEQAVLISLRGFDGMYTHDNAAFQRHLVTLCQRLTQRGHQPVLLIQARAYGADNDLNIADQIQQQAPQARIFNPFAIPSACANWELVMAALALCRTSIAIRYHTAVLSLATGRMPFNLYYSNKGQDLSVRLGIPGCNLNQFDPDTQLATIEATASQTFDHATLRQQVLQDFQTCYQKVCQ